METYQYNRACHCTRCRARHITGPVVLMTLGVLFLLDNFGVYGADFERTWPLILIMIGFVKVFQNTASTEDHIPPVAFPPPGPGMPAIPQPGPPPPSNEVRNV